MLNINITLEGRGFPVDVTCVRGKMILSQTLWLVFLPSYFFCLAFQALVEIIVSKLVIE